MGEADPPRPPRYSRYRAAPRLLRPRARGERERALERLGEGPAPAHRFRRRIPRPAEQRKWYQRITPRRVLAAVVGLVVFWLVLSVVLFFISSLVEEEGPSGSLKGVLAHAGPLLTSANNILVLGSDDRPIGTHEPGANIVGQPSRSDVMLVIRTGGGHAGRLSIPRDTLVNIPGYGEQKINAAYYFGGPALAVKVVENFLGIKINHVVEMNFTTFPDLINAMGGVNYTGGCVYGRLDGGSSNGGYTLRITAGTHHLSGEQALALARIRENLCNPAETELTRERRQQKLFASMKSQIFSFGGFLRLPWIAWDAPRAIRSDISGFSLLELLAAMFIGGSGRSQILEPTGQADVPGVGDALTITPAAVRADVKRFLSG
jgi:LCP family protein required for cell wall assembly